MRHLIVLLMLFVGLPLLAAVHVVSGGSTFIVGVGIVAWWIGPGRLLRMLLGLFMIARALDP